MGALYIDRLKMLISSQDSGLLLLLIHIFYIYWRLAMSDAQEQRALEIMNIRENELIDAKRKVEQAQKSLDAAQKELDAAQNARDNQDRSKLS